MAKFDISLLDLDGLDTVFTPKCVVPELTQNMFVGVPESVKVYARTLRDSKWNFFVVDQTRGYCNWKNKTITIPSWVFTSSKYSNDIGFRTWYIAHEISHAFTPYQNHGPRFMEKLIEICPEDCIHHEIGYKPRNAIAAGIMLKL